MTHDDGLRPDAGAVPPDPPAQPSSKRQETVSVPDALVDVFREMQGRVERHFDSRIEDPTRAAIEIGDERYILVRAAAMSVEFFDLVASMYRDRGEDEARRVAENLLFDVAHTLGKADARAFHARVGGDDPMARLSTGPIHFAYAGWAFVTILPQSSPVPNEDFFLIYDHPFSFESDAWLRRGRRSRTPVCIMNAGYSSGWCEESFGLPLVSAEIECLARGDARCRFIMAPPSRIDAHVGRTHGGAQAAGRSDRPEVNVPEYFQRKRLEDALRESHHELEIGVLRRTAQLQETNDALQREIQERMRVERALRESEARFRRVVESNMIGIAFWRADGVITDANDYFIAMTGYDRDDLRAGRLDWTRMTPPESRARDLQAMARFRVGAGAGVVETELIRRQGGRTPVLIGGASMGGDHDEGVAFVLDVSERRRDDEERRRLELQVQNAQKLDSLGVLAGGVAHDFNNLLVGILGAAALALSRLPPDSPARALVESVEMSAQRAADLTRQMLAYSGRGRFVVERVNLSRLVEEMTRLLRASVSKFATLDLRLAADLPDVEVDATQIRQVVMNLITNASDALEEQPGAIRVGTGLMHVDAAERARMYMADSASDGPFVYVSVADTGVGMDRETMSKIFDPFYSTKFLGRGLGLAAVLGIVRGHCGLIQLESEPGGGARFIVGLPAAPKPTEPQPDTPAASDSARALSAAQTVPIVDDEEAVRNVAQAILERHGLHVLTAADGHQALERVESHRASIGVIVLDLTMPRMSGEQTYHELRRLAPEIPIVVSSGYTEQDATKRFGSEGLAGFIQKPYRPADLLAVLRTALGGE